MKEEKNFENKIITNNTSNEKKDKSSSGSSEDQKISKLAIAALVIAALDWIGLTSLIFFLPHNWEPLTGIVLGFVAYLKIKKNPKKYRGGNVAIIAIIASILKLVVSIVGGLMFFFLLGQPW